MDANGDIIVPTFAECCEYAKNYTNNEHFYVQEGYEQLVKKFPSDNHNEIFANIRVLPIKSDPTSVDGDLDYYNDNEDKNKLIRDDMLIKDTIIDDTNCLNDGYTPYSSNKKITDTDGSAVERYIDNDDPNKKKKSGMEFKRELSEIRRIDGFSLTPEENSDYTFTVSNEVCPLLRSYLFFYYNPNPY